MIISSSLSSLESIWASDTSAWIPTLEYDITHVFGPFLTKLVWDEGKGDGTRDHVKLKDTGRLLVDWSLKLKFVDISFPEAEWVQRRETLCRLSLILQMEIEM